MLAYARVHVPALHVNPRRELDHVLKLRSRLLKGSKQSILPAFSSFMGRESKKQKTMAQSHSAETTFQVAGLAVTDHIFKLPLDHTGQTPGEIDVFCREVCHRNKKEERSKTPYLLYLQGGPGFEGPRPLDSSGWIKQAVNYFRVILMDQRGTGRSSPTTCSKLSQYGSPEEQAQYLKLFRADSIVKDAEAIRQALVSRNQPWEGKWSILGQSFGGFCCLSYLSMAPEGLLEVLMTGGIPPRIHEVCSADSALQATYKRVITQNKKFYERFPMDVERVHQVVRHLMNQPEGRVVTPAGNYITPRSLQAMGLAGLGFSLGFERLHYFLENAFDGDELSFRFKKEFDAWFQFDTNPLYAIMHESIYCQEDVPAATIDEAKDNYHRKLEHVQGNVASNWAGHRVRNTVFKGVFDAEASVNRGDPVMFTGEMVYPWLFDDFAELRKIKDAAELVAQATDWTPLYDPKRLAETVVPVAAATYFEDMYVDCHLAQETVAGVKGMRQWVTSDYLHCGIREAGGVIFEKLLNMARNGILVR